jgi:hypothetical protein
VLDCLEVAPIDWEMMFTGEISLQVECLPGFLRSFNAISMRGPRREKGGMGKGSGGIGRERFFEAVGRSKGIEDSEFCKSFGGRSGSFQVGSNGRAEAARKCCRCRIRFAG